MIQLSQILENGKIKLPDKAIRDLSLDTILVDSTPLKKLLIEHLWDKNNPHKTKVKQLEGTGNTGGGGITPGGALLAVNNLSDLANPETARINLGLGVLATLNEVDTQHIADGAVTHIKYQLIPSHRILGRVAAGAGQVQELTGADGREITNTLESGTEDHQIRMNILLDERYGRLAYPNLWLEDNTFEKAIGSHDFLPELVGWKLVNPNGQSLLDIRGILVDELYAKAFIADLDLALLSGHIVTKSVTQVSRNFVVPAIGNTGTLYVEDLPGFPNSQVFEDNDWIRLQVVDRSGGGLKWFNVWVTINPTTYNTAGDENDGEQSFGITVQYAGIGGNAVGETVHAGAAAQDWGQSGDGFIEQQAAGPTGSNRPYLRIGTWTDDPSIPANINSRVMLGNITDSIGTEGVQAGFNKDNGRTQLFIGNSQYSLDWNYLNEGRLTIRGGITQRPSGETVEQVVFRGDFVLGTLYYKGDEVLHNDTLWLYYNNTPTDNTTPGVDNSHWRKSDGEEGPQGPQGNPGPQGDEGPIGPDGDPGPGLVHRGVYSSSATYYKFPERVDVVWYDNDHWLVNVTTGVSGSSSLGTPGTNSNWALFGAIFESVATKLLLAEDAVITKTLTMGTADPNNPMAGNNGIIQSANYDPDVDGFRLEAVDGKLFANKGRVGGWDILAAGISKETGLFKVDLSSAQQRLAFIYDAKDRTVLKSGTLESLIDLKNSSAPSTTNANYNESFTNPQSFNVLSSTFTVGEGLTDINIRFQYESNGAAFTIDAAFVGVDIILCDSGGTAIETAISNYSQTFDSVGIHSAVVTGRAGFIPAGTYRLRASGTVTDVSTDNFSNPALGTFTIGGSSSDHASAVVYPDTSMRTEVGNNGLLSFWGGSSYFYLSPNRFATHTMGVSTWNVAIKGNIKLTASGSADADFAYNGIELQGKRVILRGDRIESPDLPTSTAGLQSGRWYRDGNFIKIV